MNFKCEEGFTRGSRMAVGSGVGGGGAVWSLGAERPCSGMLQPEA